MTILYWNFTITLSEIINWVSLDVIDFFLPFFYANQNSWIQWVLSYMSHMNTLLFRKRKKIQNLKKGIDPLYCPREFDEYCKWGDWRTASNGSTSNTEMLLLHKMIIENFRKINWRMENIRIIMEYKCHSKKISFLWVAK